MTKLSIFAAVILAAAGACCEGEAWAADADRGVRGHDSFRA
jgi:hypothetical protein